MKSNSKSKTTKRTTPKQRQEAAPAYGVVDAVTEECRRFFESPQGKAAVLAVPKETPQTMAESFRQHAKTAGEKANRFVYRQDAPELAASYLIEREIIGMLRSFMTQHFPDTPALPELPTVAGTSFYKGMVDLKEYCEQAAAMLARPQADSESDDHKGNGEPRNGIPYDDSNRAFASTMDIVKKWNGKTIGKGHIIRLDPTKLKRFMGRHKVAMMERGRRCRIHTQQAETALRSYGKELANLEATPEFIQDVADKLTAFRKSTVWECNYCNHKMNAASMPAVCPKCKHPGMTKVRK